MLKAELYKCFIKNKMLVAVALFFALSAASAFSFNVPVIGYGLSGGIYSSGASLFIGRDNINWLLVVLIVFISIKLWINEYKSEMHIYNLTAKNGRLRLAGIKLLILIVTVIVCSLVSDIITLSAYSLKLGADAVPLAECGINYSGSTREITAGAAACVTVVLHIFGYLYYAVFCSFFAVLIKSAIAFTGSAVALLIIPVYVFSDIYDRLRLPVLVTLMHGGKMLYGGNSLFNEISDAEIAVNIILQGIVSVILAAVSVALFCGKKPGFILRPLVLTIAVTFLVSGCSGGGYETAGENYILVDTETVYRKSDGAFIDINPTPFTNRTAQAVYNDTAIVWENYGNTAVTYQIKAIDLQDLSERVLLTIGKAVNMNGFLGLDDLVEIPPELTFDDLYMASRSFIFEDDILYLFSDSAVILHDTLTGEQKIIKTDGPHSNFSVDNGNIYSLDKHRKLNKNFKPVIDFSVGGYIVNNGVIAYSKENTVVKASGGITEEYDCDNVSVFLYCDEDTVVFTTDKGTAVIKNGKENFFDYFADSADGENLYCFSGANEDCIMRY